MNYSKPRNLDQRRRLVKHTLFLIGVILVLYFKNIGDSWREIAIDDLTSIRRILQTQTPCAINNNDRAFNSWLENGYLDAKKMTEHVSSYIDYLNVLKFYVSGFHDEHIYLKKSSFLNDGPAWLWPGFVINYKKNDFIVVNSQEDIIPSGSKIIECNNKTMKLWMLEDVFPFSENGSNPCLEADWVARTPYTFINEGNIFRKHPKECVFEYHGKRRKCKLKWETFPEDFDFSRLAYTYKPEFEINELSDKKSVWIAIPSFDNSKKYIDAVKHLQNMLDELTRFRKYQTIIFDLRGNTGGNSEWGVKILEKIYGENYIMSVLESEPMDSSVQWRVSKDNLTYLRNRLSMLNDTVGSDSSTFKDVLNVGNLMEDVIRNNQKKALIKEVAADRNKKNVINHKPLWNGKLIAVIDGRCASACLDFLDLIKEIPGSSLIGEQTHADSIYVDIRFEELPSRLISIGFPIKMILNRFRKTNEPHMPQYKVENINDTESLKKQILAISDMGVT